VPAIWQLCPIWQRLSILLASPTRCPDTAAVDRHAGADLDVVLDDDATGLADFLLGGIFGVTKPVLSDPLPG